MLNPNSIEFAKKCLPYNRIYYNIFGYTPNRHEYACTYEEYLNALIKATEEGKELSTLLKKKKKD